MSLIYFFKDYFCWNNVFLAYIEIKSFDPFIVVGAISFEWVLKYLFDLRFMKTLAAVVTLPLFTGVELSHKIFEPSCIK